MTFEKFIQDKHAEQYEGLDDNMPENYDDWFEGLDGLDWLILGEKYALEKSVELFDELRKGLYNART